MRQRAFTPGRRQIGVLALTLGTLTAIILAALAGLGTAASKSAPANTAEPKIFGSAVEGATLSASAGSWSGTQPISFKYQWLRCDRSGGSCAPIPGETKTTTKLGDEDVARTIRVRVTGSNDDGTTTATSNASDVVKAAGNPPASTTAPKPPETGCPTGTGVIPIAQLTAPARLLVDRFEAAPTPITRSTNNVSVRFHVTACAGRAVQGAIVYVTGVPYNQFSIPPEQATNESGWAELNLTKLPGFPAAQKQQLLVMFVRARKQGENVLAGISTRRLVSTHVALGR
jgi:hypothetical protein